MELPTSEESNMIGCLVLAIAKPLFLAKLFFPHGVFFTLQRFLVRSYCLGYNIQLRTTNYKHWGPVLAEREENVRIRVLHTTTTSYITARNGTAT
jgi:hypothetical protein